MSKLFRTKSVIKEAIQFTGKNGNEIMSFMSGAMGSVVTIKSSTHIEIETLEGVMFADKGDWIIKGVKGEFYPCKSDIFELSYEEVP